MALLNNQNTYAQQEADVFFDDGREIELLHHVHNQPNIDELRGSPRLVLEAIDNYARTKYLMNVGKEKGRIVTDLISELKPRTMIELGGYIGYSAILFGDALRSAGGDCYWSLERNPEFAAITKALVELAGLSDVVKVVMGPSSTSLRQLHEHCSVEHVDMLFLDHYKPAYVHDLKLCEQLQLVRPGTVLVADNVIKPGNPPYLDYVRSSPAEKRSQKGRGMDAMEFPQRTTLQYGKGETAPDHEVEGDANLIYESKLVTSFEPTGIPDGVEITRCVGKESAPRL